MATMTAKYKPYPAYKPSGIEWLGEIPAHWEVKRLKHMVSKIGSGKTPRGGAERYETEGVMLLRSQNVHFGGLVLTDVAYIDTGTDNEMSGSRVQEGDVLLNITGASLGRSCVARLKRKDANVNQHVCILRTDQQRDKPEFLAYSIESNFLQDQIFNNENGVSRDALNFEQIGDLTLARPVTREQRAITAYLDRETAKIDALVSKKERLMELLQEKRTALISRAVTKGLDPAVAMRDSGVEWLGEIPAHWEVKRLKHLLREPLQYGANEPSNHIDFDSPRYIRITDIAKDGTLREDTFRSIPPEIAEPYLLAEGDLLFARSGATVGKTFQYHPTWGRAAYAGYLIRARLDKTIAESDFLEYFTRSQDYTDWLLRNLIQSTIQNVSAERYAGLTIPLPPLSEQRTIVTSLKQDDEEINNLVTRVQEAIARLKEFRTALISAAVTGRIDVREGAACT